MKRVEVIASEADGSARRLVVPNVGSVKMEVEREDIFTLGDPTPRRRPIERIVVTIEYPMADEQGNVYYECLED